MGEMNMQSSFTGIVPGVGRQDVSIIELLHWAFQRELASLDFDEFSKETGAKPGIGVEWVLIEQAKLGCTIDGGGRTDPHHDADIVASALAVLPENVGGRQMAIWIAELSRSGSSPDWGRDWKADCEPVDWRNSKHGRYAAREFNRNWLTKWPANLIPGKEWGYVCPVKYSGTSAEISSARVNYLRWYGALLELRNTFQIHKNLTAFTVTNEMPPLQPWKNPLT